MTLKSRIPVFLLVALLVAGSGPICSWAADGLSPEVRRLQTRWEAIKFGVPEGDDQTNQMNALGEEADAVATRLAGMPEALIWDGIITSERASMASTFYALGFAKRARDILEQAYNSIRRDWMLARRPALACCTTAFPAFQSDSAIRLRRGSYSNRPSSLPQMGWMPGIFTATSFTPRTNFRRPPQSFNTPSKYPPIQIVRSGTRTAVS